MVRFQITVSRPSKRLWSCGEATARLLGPQYSSAEIGTSSGLDEVNKKSYMMQS